MKKQSFRLSSAIAVLFFFALLGAGIALLLIRQFDLTRLRHIGCVLLAYAGGITVVGLILMHGMAKSMQNMAEQDRIQRMLAYHDSLTGLRNANSYNAWARDFDEQIKAGTDGLFGLMVLDINDLKEVNDRMGHAAGNRVIIATAEMLKCVFEGSPVFRIGGDEFLVILHDRDLLRFTSLIENFLGAVKALSVSVEEETLPITVAYGTAIFDMDTDHSFNDVFRRADEIMYEQKRKMKEPIKAVGLREKSVLK